MTRRQAANPLQTGGTPVSPVVVPGVAGTATSFDAWANTPRAERVPTDPARPWLPPPRPAPEQTSRLVLEYAGTDFVGWAKQPGRRSVEGELERVFAQLLGGTVPKLIVGGRTDTGVHAAGQVLAYDAEAIDPYSFNALLPPDIAVLESVPTRPGFDARNEALSRTYRYQVLNRRPRSVPLRATALHWARPLDLPTLEACAAALVGTHDFTAFTPTASLHQWFRRTVDAASWTRDGDLLTFEVTADSFLRHMNRTLVGTMLEVGIGARRVEDFLALLAGAERPTAGWTAPPVGLTLQRISYPAPLLTAGR